MQRRGYDTKHVGNGTASSNKKGDTEDKQKLSDFKLGLERVQ